MSAAINMVEKLEPVGQITEKYQTVRAAGIYLLFVTAQDQPGNLPNYPGISVERAPQPQ